MRSLNVTHHILQNSSSEALRKKVIKITEMYCLNWNETTSENFFILRL